MDTKYLQYNTYGDVDLVLGIFEDHILNFQSWLQTTADGLDRRTGRRAIIQLAQSEVKPAAAAAAAAE